MKFLMSSVIVVACAFTQTAFADSLAEAQQLASEIIEVSGLAAVMKQDQPNDLENLQRALAQGISEDAQLKADIIDIRDHVLPQIKRIQDQNLRDAEYFKIQLALTTFAFEHGYTENNN